MRNELRNEIRLRRRLYHQCQLHGRLSEPNRLLGRGKLCAVNNVPPLDQFGERLRIESKLLRCNCCQKFCARFEVWVVKLFARMVLAEMLRILGFQKSALMMVEPPGQQRRGRILEIDNHIFVAIKYSALEWMRGFVRHPPV